MRYLILVTVLLGLVTGRLWASPLVISDHPDVVALGQYTEYFLDESRALSFEDARSAVYTPNTEPALNFGFTQARIWMRFQIDNPLDVAVARVLDVRYFMLDHITLYVPDGNNGYRPINNGRLDLQLQEHPRSRFYNFPLNLPAHSHNQFYLSVDSDEAIGLPILLSTPEEQQRYQVQDTLFMTLYGSLILSTLLFALFMFVSLRERELAYYAAFLFSHHLIALMAMEGVPTALFNITHPYIIRELVPLSIAVAILFAVLFQRNFLHFKTVNPPLYRFTQWMAAAMWLAILINFVAPHFIAMFVVTVVCMIVGSCIMVCCFIQLRQQREARHFLMAWSAGILGATIYGLKVFQVLPVTIVTSYSWHVGTMLEAVLFSYTIAQRVNIERRQRLQTQTELADRERTLRLTQEQLLIAETAAKEELEIRVRERTRDISRILAELETENKSLVELSINDGLTRVRNRRFFNDIYPQLWHDALDQQQWFSVIMLDIDHFKGINDQYGHLMGDRCLTVIAGVLKQMVSRPTDVVCRYGGEEFIMLLPETDMESARWVAERIRKKISETLCDLDDQAVTVTASLGVAGMIPEQGLDPMKLVAVCDEALFRSKQEGRNRVTLAGKPVAPSNVSPLNRRQQ